MTRYRIDAERSRASLTAHAPGHDFRANGAGVSGELELDLEQEQDGPRLASLRADFPLGALDAGDLLGNRELKKFLGLESGARVMARAELLAPFELRRAPDGQLSGTARVRFSIERRVAEIDVALSGTTSEGVARFTLTFTGLGYQPPKLLFFKVRDNIDVEVHAVLSAATPSGL